MLISVKTAELDMTREECEVNRALALILYVSRLFGVAPVRLDFHSGGCRVQYSFFYDICGRLLFGCLCKLMMFFMNISTPNKIPFRTINAAHIVISGRTMRVDKL